MPVKINIDPNKVKVKVEKASEKAIWAITSEIMDDCNEYVKYAEGDLERSSLIHSLPGKGVIIWQKPYAKRQYWEIKTAHKDYHPKATWKWCEVAKKYKLKQWTKQVEKAFKDNL